MQFGLILKVYGFCGFNSKTRVVPQNLASQMSTFFNKIAVIHLDKIAYRFLYLQLNLVEYFLSNFLDTLYKVTTSTQLREFKYNTGKTI